MHFEFLVEDESGTQAMKILLPKLIGNSETYRIHPYKGIGHIPKGNRPKTGANKRILDLFDNSVSCLTSLAKYCVFCCFIRKLFGELKFPNNSIARSFVEVAARIWQIAIRICSRYL